MGASWGAEGLSVPGTCETSGGGSGGSAGTVAVTFNVQATTQFGENIYICGSVDALEDWSPDNAIILSAANYPTWSGTLSPSRPPCPLSRSLQSQVFHAYDFSLS